MNNSLRIILAQQRKTVADVHEATGLSKYTITQIYYERTENPEYKTVAKIADYLGVTVDELMSENVVTQ